MSTREDQSTLKSIHIWERVQECCWRKLGGPPDDPYGYICDYHEGYVDGWKRINNTECDHKSDAFGELLIGYERWGYKYCPKCGKKL